MALAASHGFVEMAEIFAGLSRGFCRTLGFHSYLEGTDAVWHV